GGSGGLVAVDRKGNVSLPFNSPGMYRACCGLDGEINTGIYR
ncbi:beta-aspartyl-peptidase, partial [Brucella lupini]